MIIRYGTAIAIGTAVTLALFWLMQMLISLQHGEPIEPRERDILGFHPEVEEQPLVTDRMPPKFTELTDPVELTPPRPGNDASLITVGARITPKSARPPAGTGWTISGMQDGPLVAMVRVRPVYPIRASEKNLEGYVVVQFDVSADGSVTNVSVVESTHALFEKSAIDAARKFRYKARVVDGVPRGSVGIRNVFRFEMERT